MEKEIIWQNGQLVYWEDAKVHVLTHTLHYGGGAYEGIRAYETENGPAIFRLDEHIDRLFYSGEVIGMRIPYSKGQIKQACIELLKRNQLSECYIRPLVYYGYKKMGVNPSQCPVELMIACWPWGKYLSVNRVDIKTSSYIRIHPKSTVADAKICGHYVNGILASQEVENTHYHEALLLDAEGYVAEGVGENIFIIKDGIAYTPQLGTILAGITRQTAIEMLELIGIQLIETKLTVDDVLNADEAFFTGTAAEITPIRSLDDHIIGLDRLGQISEKVQSMYHTAIRGKDAQFDHYLTYIN